MKFINCVFFLIFYLCQFLKSNYFVTFLDSPEYFLFLKNNIGVVHKYYPNSYVIVILDCTSKRYSAIIDKISFWKQVHILDRKNVFLNYKQNSSLYSGVKTNLRAIEYIFENYFFIPSTKVFVFNIFVSLFKSRTILNEIFSYRNISFSENHFLLNYYSFKYDLKTVFSNIKLNRYGVNDINLVNLYLDNLKIKKTAILNNTLSCRVNFKEMHFSSMFIDEKDFQATKTDIAILIPTLNFDTKIENNAFFKHTLLSLNKTISQSEFKNYSITIYIAYDENDIFLRDINNINIHRSWITEVFGKYKNIFVKYTKFPVSSSVVFLWNSLFVEAFKDGNKYFVQLNDDTEIKKNGWLSDSIKYFENGFNGVIGFNSKEWGCKLYTQTIVSRQHYYNTNGNFYPIVFHNCMSDIWITEFYKNNNICLKNVITRNHFSKTRYSKCPFNKKLLKKLLGSFHKIY